MTNIQAINLLKGLEQSLDDYYGLNDEGKTAFHITITALELFGNTEQFPSAQQEQLSEIQDILDYLDTVLHPIVSPEHWSVYSELHDMISMLPPAQSRKTGKWVHLGGDEWCCDKCGFVITTEGSWEHPHDIGAKYCQNCGAKMKE